LEYADIVWDNCCMHDKTDLDTIQDEAAITVTQPWSNMQASFF